MTHRSTGIPAILVSLCIFVGGAQARTWTVEKDGFGEFSVVQDAIDAAAPGDSILIGPGRFEERPWYDNERFIGRIVAAVGKSNLTFIGVGTGPEGTILGPSTPDYLGENQQTIGMSFPLGELGLSLRGIQFENMNIGIAVGSPGIDIRNCKFVEYGSSGVTIGYSLDDVLIDGCQFEVQRLENIQAIGWDAGFRSNNVVIRNSEFQGNHGAGVSFGGGDGLLVENCQFGGYAIGVSVRYATNAIVRDCKVAGTIGNFGLFVQFFSSVSIQRCDIDGASGFFALGLDGSTAVVEDCRLRGGIGGVVRPDGGGDYYVRNCRIERQPGTWYVESYLDADFTDRADMRFNWWGETDSTTIANGILDGRTADPQECIDNPTLYYCPRDTVDFWPVLDEPPFVESGQATMGVFKGRFRRSGGSP